MSQKRPKEPPPSPAHKRKKKKADLHQRMPAEDSNAILVVYNDCKGNWNLVMEEPHIVSLGYSPAKSKGHMAYLRRKKNQKLGRKGMLTITMIKPQRAGGYFGRQLPQKRNYWCYDKSS
jgi:hypothetical protein